MGMGERASLAIPTWQSLRECAGGRGLQCLGVQVESHPCLTPLVLPSKPLPSAAWLGAHLLCWSQELPTTVGLSFRGHRHCPLLALHPHTTSNNLEPG